MARGPKTQPRKIPRQSRAKATVAAIVEAAAHILEERGFEETNVNVVAERAGVSIGSLYQYFPSKEALVAAVAEQLVQAMIERMTHDIADIGVSSPADAVAALVSRVFAAFGVRPRLQRVLRTEVPSVLPHFASPEFDATLLTLVVAYLEAHRAELSIDDAELAGRTVFAAVEGVMHRFAHQPDVDQPALQRETITLVTRYLGVASPQ